MCHISYVLSCVDWVFRLYSKEYDFGSLCNIIVVVQKTLVINLKWNNRESCSPILSVFILYYFFNETSILCKKAWCVDDHCYNSLIPKQWRIIFLQCKIYFHCLLCGTSLMDSPMLLLIVMYIMFCYVIQIKSIQN